MYSTPLLVQFLTSLLPAPALSSSLTVVACVLAFGFSLTAPAPDSTSSPLLSVEGPPPLSYLTYYSSTIDYDAVRTGFDSTSDEVTSIPHLTSTKEINVLGDKSLEPGPLAPWLCRRRGSVSFRCQGTHSSKLDHCGLDRSAK